MNGKITEISSWREIVEEKNEEGERKDESVEEISDRLENIMKEFKDPELMDSLQKTFQMLGTTKEGKETLEDFMERWK